MLGRRSGSSRLGPSSSIPRRRENLGADAEASQSGLDAVRGGLVNVLLELTLLATTSVCFQLIATPSWTSQLRLGPIQARNRRIACNRSNLHRLGIRHTVALFSGKPP